MSESVNIVDKFFGANDNNNNFKLSQQFKSQYSGKNPVFGYNGLGEATYYRTYSRIKEDGTKEKFFDTALRIIEGTYEIQRRYCKWMHLPYDPGKAQDSAQEMFERMWAFKWLPPGRGMWIMGTPFMWRSGGASLNNCFKGDTEFITREGIKKLEDCVNTTQKVLTSGGKWVDAKIKSFGVQSLQKVVVRRGRWRKSIFATADHRWFVHSKSKKFATVGAADDSKNACIRECTTSELESGIRLSMNFGSGINNTNLRPSAFGISHGICFGDGTTGSDNENHGTYLYLCKPKDEQLEKFFSACYKTEAPEKGEHGAIRVADLPRMFRKAPDMNESSTYLYGFLSGYFAADGDVTNNGTVRIASSERSNLELVQSICAILGIGTYEISQGLQTVRRKGKVKKFVGYRLTLMAEHLNSEFFLIDEHKKRFDARIKTSRKKIPTYQSWYVDSVEDTPLVEEVFCPQVPETYCFTLAGNILTGNCGFVSTNDDIESDPSQPFAFAMDMLMLGVGIGFDTKGAGRVKIKKPNAKTSTYKIEDSREGWVRALSDLIRSYTIKPELGKLEFDYSDIRKKGTPIKGFGGQASGPEGLMELLQSTDEFLGKRIKTKMTSVDIADLMNLVGKCVVAGNVRRSAEIAFGFPDDIEYRSMKNPTRDLTPYEISEFYKVTGELYGQNRYSATIEDFSNAKISREKIDRVIEVWNAMNDRRWASNNSVFSEVGMDYTEVGHSTAVNGEPGYIWLDNMRDYGRMKEGRQPGIDGRVMGSNPCFAGTNNLLTQDGYKSIEQLWVEQGKIDFDGFDADMLQKYGSQTIVNNIGLTKATKIYRTDSNAEVFRVKFSDGSWIDATSNHEFITINKSIKRIGNNKKKVFYIEERYKLKDLKIGQLVPLNQQTQFGTFNDEVYAELAGWCIGDGSLSPRSNGQTRAECTTYNEDANDVLPRLRGLMLQLFETHSKSKQVQPLYSGWNRDFSGTSFDHEETRIGSSVLGRLLTEDGIVCGDKHNVPKKIWYGTKNTICAFLKGLASADGYVNLTKDSISVRIWQVNDNLLQQCRLLLNQLGIASTVQFRREERKVRMNDGKGGLKEYNCKPGWELIISGIKQVSKFFNDIGFIQNWKSEKAIEWLSGHGGSNNSDTGKYVKIESINSIGFQTVYCLTEPETNQVVVNGYQVGQCVEQTLESYELCVSGDTRIQTKSGALKIIDCVGKDVEVWNGTKWSKVQPRKTGTGRSLRRVKLSDGSYLDATSNHKWSVKKESGKIVEVETDLLYPGDILESFQLPVIDGTFDIPDLLGSLAAGDNTVINKVVDVYKKSVADQLLDSRMPLPEIVFTMGTEASAQFLLSWARIKGVVSLRDSKIMLIAPEHRLYELQLIARRANQSCTAIDLQSGVLTIDNISGSLSVLAGGKNGVEPVVVEQSVVSIDRIPDLHDTYCFDEPLNHKGVFNNVITHQCNLVESFPVKHDNETDYMRTIKYAYLYGKTVTLLPTHCDRTNRVMLRNRRIGLSQSGIVQGFEKFGRRRYIHNFCDAAYSEIKRWDRIYSEYLVCRPSIKVTSVKPSGTVSLIAGVTPGIHFPEARSYWRRMRLAANSALVKVLQDAGYHIEPSVTDPNNTVVVKFGVEDVGVRSIEEVSIWEQMDNVAALQHYWADNAVSVTIQFKPDEAKDIPKILEHYEDRIKAVSFLPHSTHGYVQAPYEKGDKDEIMAYNAKLKPIDFSLMLEEATGERFCSNDSCTIN